MLSISGLGYASFIDRAHFDAEQLASLLGQHLDFGLIVLAIVLGQQTASCTQG
ncbi:hypothetical protein D3C81_2022680 [compost metagenome]